MEKEIKKEVSRLISPMLLEDNYVVEKVIGFLIEERERTRERIDDIMYDSITKELSEKDIKEIVKGRNTNIFMYNTICKLEELRKKNESK